MLKFSACSENCKKLCWTFQHVLKTVTHIEKVCWKFQCILKTVMQVQNYVEYFKVCWKTSWKFQGMLKPVICVENYVETAFWKFQCVLKTVMHVENYIEISRCVENVYVRHFENCVEIRKNHHHSLRCMLKLSGRGLKIRWQTTRFDSEFTRVTEVRHIYVSLQLRVQNWRTKWNFLLNVCTMCKLSECYSRIFQIHWFLNHLDVHLVWTTSETSQN